MKIMHVVGARPNFMKVAPVMQALARWPETIQVLVHTGQHYDKNMSELFFQELELPAPDINLGIGSDSQTRQTARTMIGLEDTVLSVKPDLVLVYGDVNSTLAAALVCAKLQTRVGHVEAGLRSCDRTMPEEINRLVTDQLADLLFTPSSDGNENLLREGIPPEKIHLVGNVMIDTLVRLLPQAKVRLDECLSRFSLDSPYGLVTLHRPSNVDDTAMLATIMATLEDLSVKLPLLFPVHPRTRERIQTIHRQKYSPSLLLADPLGYLDFLALMSQASVVITDSGGIQEETTFLGVPCLTMRDNTERPITVTCGTNVLVGRDMRRLSHEFDSVLGGRAKAGSRPLLWDGRAAERIANIILGGTDHALNA